MLVSNREIPKTSPVLTFATWNVNSLRVRLGHVQDWLQQNKVDVLTVQETKLQDHEFPIEAFTSLGYHAIYSGQKTYNGVATFSKRKTSDVQNELPGLKTSQKRFLGATYEGVRVLNFYVVNGSEPGSEKFAFKMQWFAAMKQLLEKESSRFERVLVLGDFNVAPGDMDVHDPEVWRNKILCSDEERSALQSLFDLGYKDVFRFCNPDERSFSWWDYRQGSFRKNAGLRIDLLLASESLARDCQKSWIDPSPRIWERPSDHVPVVAQFHV